MHRLRMLATAGVIATGLVVGAGVSGADAAGATTITGRVTCINSTVEGVWIQAQSSASGWASWSMPIVLGGLSQADFRFTLNRGGQYQVHVGCGGSSRNWKVDAKSGWVSGSGHRFTCNDIGNFLALIGNWALKREFGFKVDLTQGVSYGACKG
ncbi:hypothetical protein [Arthrobacter sp. MI7-26]|uniref:hypothetical protein n=1 Tax=Arthrobacter sp. MI7-26 TaxID=2993653 RepID=UPI002249561D|nr:hypothetical protein [Arthrobacter sp. MI7-26]